MATVLLWFIVEEFMGVLIRLGLNVLNILGGTGADYIVSENSGSGMHDLE
jgi:hypothetical protein